MQDMWLLQKNGRATVKNNLNKPDHWAKRNLMRNLTAEGIKWQLATSKWGIREQIEQTFHSN